MFKALLATAAVTVCCLGNEYPAKAWDTQQRPYVEDWGYSDNQRAINEYNLRQQRHQIEQLQRRMDCRPGFYCN